MKYFASSQYIKNNKMIRTLRAVNVEGDILDVGVKNIRELHVYWDHLKYNVPHYLLDPLLKYPAPVADGETIALTNAGMLAVAMAATMKKKSKLSAPPKELK